jgi:hypothetical protein
MFWSLMFIKQSKSIGHIKLLGNVADASCLREKFTVKIGNNSVVEMSSSLFTYRSVLLRGIWGFASFLRLK